MANKKALEELAVYLETQVKPELFYMPSYFYVKDCGTAGCIAGTYCLKEGWLYVPGTYEMVTKGDSSHLASEVAISGLALDKAEASLLFDPYHWPRKFRSHGADRVAPQEAAARIRYFNETGK